MGKAQRLIAIVGAGPAGLFAAASLLKSGHQVVLLNRDIKPGGLVEYGVFPTKHKFKNGLRKQFVKALEHEGASYRGGVEIGAEGALSLGGLLEMGFDAVLVAVGAQGTRRLGLPGEDAVGVYHAKDLVYHYNRLPPFASQSYPVGQKVVIIGVGNVMIDVVHWLAHFVKNDEVIAVSRTVPRFRKWVDKETRDVARAIDDQGMAAEIDRIRGALIEVGEDPDEDLKAVLKYSAPASEKSTTRWRVRWLVQPREIALDEEGRCKGLVVDHLRPEAVPDRGRPRVKTTGTTELIEADNVIFAIGDSVQPSLGIPAHVWGFQTLAELSPEAWAAGYRLLKADKSGPFKGAFVVGWAREASTGLVGNARKDGVKAAGFVDEWLGRLETEATPLEQCLGRLDEAITREQGGQVIDYPMIKALLTAEQARAVEDSACEGRFFTNAQMLEVLGLDHQGGEKT